MMDFGVMILEENQYEMADFVLGLLRVMRMVVPSPTTEFFTKSLPLWYSLMMRRASVSPSPQPLLLEV